MNIKIIEDCAEAHGATYKQKKTGTFGDVGCYSFYANKIITTGEGGLITTDDFEVAERAKWLRAHAFGREGKHYWHEEVGYGYRMSGMQAALGSSQLDRIDRYISERQIHAWYYMSLLMPLRDEGKIDFPVQLEGYENVYWMFSILLDDRIDRADFMAKLTAKGIETRTFFYPLHKLPPYKTRDELLVTDCVSEQGVNLPSGNTLNSTQIKYVCEAIMEILG